MSPLVMKFGGSSVLSASHFLSIADLIVENSLKYPRIVVVVSAMANGTDQLLDLAKAVHPNPPRRELDMLISVGERISISLLAMALALRGREAISFTGSQSGILTTAHHSEAKIIDVRPFRILQALDQGQIAIVAGFQGVSCKGEITTLGRGGSDTTAVALAVALRSPEVHFYKDVGGIFDRDPKLHASASVLSHLSYEKAFELANTGAKVLHLRSVLLARKNGIRLRVLPFSYQGEGSLVGDEISLSKNQQFEEEAL